MCVFVCESWGENKRKERRGAEISLKCQCRIIGKEVSKRDCLY